MALDVAFLAVYVCSKVTISLTVVQLAAMPGYCFCWNPRVWLLPLARAQGNYTLDQFNCILLADSVLIWKYWSEWTELQNSKLSGYSQCCVCDIEKLTALSLGSCFLHYILLFVMGFSLTQIVYNLYSWCACIGCFCTT